MAADVQTEAPPRAGRREWIGLAVIALACVLYVMGRVRTGWDSEGEPDGEADRPADGDAALSAAGVES
jgi:hypothetical protein